MIINRLIHNPLATTATGLGMCDASASRALGIFFHSFFMTTNVVSTSISLRLAWARDEVRLGSKVCFLFFPVLTCILTWN